jgi:L-lactate dehydrogenase complex protein LldG
MSTAKEAILARIRAAQRDAPPAAPIPRGYRQQNDMDRATTQREFIEKVRDYRAEVHGAIPPARLPAVIAEICREHNVRQLAAPSDIPLDWLPEEIETCRDSPPLTSEELDQCDGVLTLLLRYRCGVCGQLSSSLTIGC